MDNFFIRSADPDDYDDFSQIQRTELPDVQKIDRIWYEGLVEKGEIIVCVDDETKKIAGFSLCQDNGSLGLLRQLAVSSAYKQKGIGSKLVIACNEWFKDRKINHVSILVKSQNTAAIKLYEKFGYQSSINIYQYIISWDTFNKVSNEGLTLQILSDKEDTSVSEKFGEKISLTELQEYRDLSSSLNLGLFHHDKLVGFARLRPNFPVLTPIIVENPLHIFDLFALVRQYCNPDFNHLRITFEGEDLQNLIDAQEFAKVNFILLKFEIDFN